MRAPLQTGAHGVGDEWEGAPAGWVPLGSAQTRGGGGALMGQSMFSLSLDCYPRWPLAATARWSRHTASEGRPPWLVPGGAARWKR